MEHLTQPTQCSIWANITINEEKNECFITIALISHEKSSIFLIRIAPLHVVLISTIEIVMHID